MSEGSEDQNDKPYEATRRKLEEARKKGEIVRSQDVINLAVLAIAIVAFEVVFRGYMTTIVQDISGFISRSASQRDTLSGVDVFGSAMGWILPLLLVLFVAPFANVFAGLVAAKQVLLTGEKVMLKLNRISPIANAKKKFGWAGLFEFAKNSVKFLIFASLMAAFALNGFELFHLAVLREEHLAIANLYEVAFRWLWSTLAAYVILAGFDVLWQIQEHAKKNRMSHKEMKDEHKNEEGDENIRQQRRAKAEAIATNRMMLDVPKAAVVITNPTHYAVALQWDGDSNTVPKCVARGTDETARKIREIAIQSGVPLYRDAPTARDLFATVKLGMMIETNHYKAVAAAIAYARRIHGMVKHEKP
jgi:flagellar biosynthetic protein FlhB